MTEALHEGTIHMIYCAVQRLGLICEVVLLLVRVTMSCGGTAECRERIILLTQDDSG